MRKDRSPHRNFPSCFPPFALHRASRSCCCRGHQRASRNCHHCTAPRAPNVFQALETEPVGFSKHWKLSRLPFPMLGKQGSNEAVAAPQKLTVFFVGGAFQPREPQQKSIHRFHRCHRFFGGQMRKSGRQEQSNRARRGNLNQTTCCTSF